MKGLDKRWLIELYLFEDIPSLRMQDIHIDKLVQFLPWDGAWHFEDELIQIIPGEAHLVAVLFIHSVSDCFFQLVFALKALLVVTERENKLGGSLVLLFEKLRRADLFESTLI